MHMITKFLWRWGPAFLMMALIFLASGTSGPDIPSFGAWDLIVKKGGHMTGYALLAAAYLHGLTGNRGAGRGTAIWAILMATLYAVTDEFHQSFTPGRNPSPVDVGIDTIGAAIGATVTTWMQALRKQ